MLTLGSTLSNQVDELANIHYDCCLLYYSARYRLYGYKQATGNLMNLC